MADLMDAVTSSMAEHAGRYLSFLLSQETYGFPILRVREIIGMQSITRVPGARSFIKGVINLRGKVIPIVDMRLRLGMPAVDQTEETCIIIVEIDNGQTGFVVDAVAEVVNLEQDALEPAPSFQDEDDTMILALGKSAGKVVVLLDVDRLLTRIT